MQRLLVLEFENAHDMHSQLARVSRFLEDPVHSEQAITWVEMQATKQIVDQYAGHNMSLVDCRRALKGVGAPLSKGERTLQQLLQQHSCTSTTYVIAHMKNDVATLQHELCHARFFNDSVYAQRVSGIHSIARVRHTKWLRDFEACLSRTYCTRVHLDEFQAILLCGEYDAPSSLLALLRSAFNSNPSSVIQHKRIPVTSKQETI